MLLFPFALIGVVGVSVGICRIRSELFTGLGLSLDLSEIVGTICSAILKLFSTEIKADF